MRDLKTNRVVAYVLTAVLGSGTLAALALSPEKEAREIVERLDRFVQGRFLETYGEFGVSRILIIPGHPTWNPHARTPQEKALVKEVNDLERSYNISLLHIEHVRGRYPNEAPPREEKPSGQQPWAQPLVRHGSEFEGALPAYFTKPEAIEKTAASRGGRALEVRNLEGKFERAAVSGLDLLKKGKPFAKRVDDWLVSARPVRATEACVQCHVGAKPGDTLSVVVYAVRDAREAAPLSKQARKP